MKVTNPIWYGKAQKSTAIRCHDVNRAWRITRYANLICGCPKPLVAREAKAPTIHTIVSYFSYSSTERITARKLVSCSLGRRNKKYLRLRRRLDPRTGVTPGGPVTMMFGLVRGMVLVLVVLVVVVD